MLSLPLTLIAAGVPLAASVADVATQGGFDPISLIGSVVTPTIVIILLLTGKLHTQSEVNRLEREAANERADREALQAILTERVIPALTKSTLVLENISPLLQTDVRLRNDASG